MADNSTVLLLYTRQEARYIHKGQDGNVEAVAETDMAGNLVGNVNVQTSCQDPWLVGNNTDCLAVDPSKANDTVCGVILVNLKEGSSIDDSVNDVTNIISFVCIGRYNGQQSLFVKGRLSRSKCRWIFKVV